MPVPDAIKRLVDQFNDHHSEYRSAGYNETQLRREFLDPLFMELGWDIDNHQGFAEPYKEVIHEDAIKIGGSTKAPDYCFRIGGTRKFFLEAKKPSVDLASNPLPAFQLRRYAWSAKLSLSILSDFEEFSVYDCRIKPSKTDKASTGRIQLLTYTDYIDKWEEISSTFSKEAILHGAFDKFAAAAKGKKGTAEVDDAFLEEIESWRDQLARVIALRNPKLTQPELNFAVQRTIDRIIFLRICEDRAIETYGQLQALLNGERTYRRMVELFYRADEKYNSGLFHFNLEKGRPEIPDELSLNLHIDDKVLKDIISRLYYPDCPYEFSVLPADILGQVYEQFLGKVIRLTEGHRAKVEDKPEVKKAGGVYYTPTYIVDYIVKNTVGKLLAEDGMTPKQAAKLRVLDPACGSGSFLIVAYQTLLDWHRDWYVKDGVDKHSTGKSPAIFQAQGGEWRLTTAERKRILLDNIYGVDIDTQAVEVTKLSLLLKVLEGESDQSINQQLKMFHERALPDLGNNIKCGNSLIRPDFFEDQLISDPEERGRINSFDWQTEFKNTIEDGGFDAIVGNPPYVRVQVLGHDDTDYFKRHYQYAWRRIDISILFMELSYNLLSARGVVGLISSNQFLSTEYGRSARHRLVSNRAIMKIVDFGDLPVFQDALTYTSIFFLVKAGCPEFPYVKMRSLDGPIGASPATNISVACLGDEPWSLGASDSMPLLSKLRQLHPPLSSCGKSWYGLITGLDNVLLFDRDSKSIESFEKNVLLPVIRAKDCGRYTRPKASKLVIYPYLSQGEDTVLLSEKDLARTSPKVYRHLANHKKELQNRKDSRKTIGDRSAWYSLVRFGKLSTFKQPKIITPGEVKRNKFTLDSTGSGYSGARVFAITVENNPVVLKPLLGILNSRLIEFYLHSVAPVKQGGYFSYSGTFLDSIPVASSALSNGELSMQVDHILELTDSLSKAKTEQEQIMFRRQIDATDKQIDQLVYELYGLTEEEIKIVESSTPQ